MEVYVDAPLKVVEERDPKGSSDSSIICPCLTPQQASTRRLALVKSRVRFDLGCVHLHAWLTSGFAEFTGVSAPYEEPLNPEIHIRTDQLDVTESVRVIVEYLESKQYI